MKKADYSKISVSYDRGRSLSQQNIGLWLKLISRYSGGRVGTRALDLGCGTGRFALPMARELGYSVVGADFYTEMLSRAREKDTEHLVDWDYQDAQDLTYNDSSFDVVFISHLLHHVDSPLQVLKECKRILTDSGVILLRYGAIEQIRHDVVHTFFPEVLAIDEARTPTMETVEKWLGEAGFVSIISEEIIQQTFETGIAHLEAAKTKNTSVLTMISQKAFKKGICDLENYIQENPDAPWLLSDRFTFTVGYVSKTN